jgi:hypothetical protein
MRSQHLHNRPVFMFFAERKVILVIQVVLVV